MVREGGTGVREGGTVVHEGGTGVREGDLLNEAGSLQGAWLREGTVLFAMAYRMNSIFETEEMCVEISMSVV